MLLVRVMIGKIEKKDRLLDIMRRTPIRQDRPGWNCVEWVKEVLEAFRSDGKTLGTSIIEWGKVRDAAMGYVQSKKDQHRFDGQVDDADDLISLRKNIKTAKIAVSESRWWPGLILQFDKLVNLWV
ncbi:hypothetical protein SLS57_006927 [Botryosphaeria dothidea]